jgi:hypothetical protein
MEELHTDSINGGHEANYGLGHVPGRGRTPTLLMRGECVTHDSYSRPYFPTQPTQHPLPAQALLSSVPLRLAHVPD